MNYTSHYQQPEYDPSSSQTLQFFDQPDYYPYSFSNPQYTNVHPYSYHNLNVQPSQYQEQEPNPPGVTAPPPPQQAKNPYHQYQGHGAAAVLTLGPQQGAVGAGIAVVHQQIVQSSYGGIGITNALGPQVGAQAHLGPKPILGRPYRVCGRGRGRALHKHSAAPAHNQTIVIQGGTHVQGGPLQPIPQPYAPSFGPIQMPFQGLAHSSPAPPPPRIAWCELCRVDCNTLEILNQHKNGKKHKKRLKMFEEMQNLNKSVITIEQTSIPELKPEVAPQPELRQESLISETEGSKVAVEKREVVEEVGPTQESGKKARIDHSVGLGHGTKRKMRGGKGGGRNMRPTKRVVEPPKPKEVIPLVCELCNVKCESSIVFQSHLAGKKHKSQAKRFMVGQQVSQALQYQNAKSPTSIAPQLLIQEFGTPAQNAKTVNFPTLENAKVEAISQPQSIEEAKFGASALVKAERISMEGHSEGGV